MPVHPATCLGLCAAGYTAAVRDFVLARAPSARRGRCRPGRRVPRLRGLRQSALQHPLLRRQPRRSRPSCALVASCVQVMEKDIPRTFVELGMFAKGGPLEDPLRDILEAYGPLARATAAMLCNAMHRRSVGLCMRESDGTAACGRRGFACFLLVGCMPTELMHTDSIIAGFYVRQVRVLSAGRGLRAGDVAPCGDALTKP